MKADNAMPFGNARFAYEIRKMWPMAMMQERIGQADMAPITVKMVKSVT